MTKKQKRTTVRIIACAALFGLAWLFDSPVRTILLFCAYAAAGYDILLRAARNILHGQVFDENFLMALATIGAIAIGRYEEAAEVMIFYQIGELFQSAAVNKSRRSIAALMDIRPEFASVLRGGVVETVDPDEVAAGEVIVVKPGERIPLDGTVLSGETMLDTAALTGESVPRRAVKGDEVMNGCINLSGRIEICVTHPYAESTVARILDLVENSSSKKAKAENFITKFARVYTPAVVGAALLLAVVPPLFVGEWSEWIRRALTFLVISCPCALVISVPLSFFGGIGGASKSGILVKGGSYLEALAKAETVVFDKTGTLTKGTFSVVAVHPQIIGEEALLEYAALAESCSNHPIARSITEAYGRPVDYGRVTSAVETAGKGVSAVVDGHKVSAGGSAFMKEQGALPRECHLSGKAVHVAVDGEYAGHIIISDIIKENSALAVSELRRSGVKNIVMLTGDSRASAEEISKEIGISSYKAELLPADKVGNVEELLKQQTGGTLVFVGDGINDAPSLSRADIGVSMGAFGSDAAVEAADVVLMDDDPLKLSAAVRIARKTLLIVKQNIWFALSVKAAVLLLGALGYASMQAAVFADVGVSVLAILNAMRALRLK